MPLQAKRPNCQVKGAITRLEAPLGARECERYPEESRKVAESKEIPRECDLKCGLEQPRWHVASEVVVVHLGQKLLKCAWLNRERYKDGTSNGTRRP